MKSIARWLRGPSSVLALSVLLAGVGGGCATPLQYAAKEDLIAKSGLDGIKKQLEDLMPKAKAPVINSVKLEEDSLTYSFTTYTMGMFYQTVPVPGTSQLMFRNLDKYEVYDNHYVFIYTGGRVDKILFGTQEDATAFVDLLWSLRASKKK